MPGIICSWLAVTVAMFRHVSRRFASCEAVKHARVRHSPKTEYLLDRTLRVDHAGEFGAVQIYKGQLAVLGHSDVASTLQVQSVLLALLPYLSITIVSK